MGQPLRNCAISFLQAPPCSRRVRGGAGRAYASRRSARCEEMCFLLFYSFWSCTSGMMCVIRPPHFLPGRDGCYCVQCGSSGRFTNFAAPRCCLSLATASTARPQEEPARFSRGVFLAPGRALGTGTEWAGLCVISSSSSFACRLSRGTEVRPCLRMHQVTLHYITLHHIASHYITFHSIPLHYITLQVRPCLGMHHFLFLVATLAARAHGQ